MLRFAILFAPHPVDLCAVKKKSRVLTGGLPRLSGGLVILNYKDCVKPFAANPLIFLHFSVFAGL